MRARETASASALGWLRLSQNSSSTLELLCEGCSPSVHGTVCAQQQQAVSASTVTHRARAPLLAALVLLLLDASCTMVVTVSMGALQRAKDSRVGDRAKICIHDVVSGLAAAGTWARRRAEGSPALPPQPSSLQRLQGHTHMVKSRVSSPEYQLQLQATRTRAAAQVGVPGQGCS